MKKILLGGVLTLVILGLVFGGFVFSKSGKAKAQDKIWIEVTNPSVWVLSSDGSPEIDLQTGDELKVGDEISTNDSGKALIHNPDGSVLRVDVNTKLTIEKSDFNTTNQATGFSIKLEAGKVWSKVLDLTTSESSWQVETSNAVATVRGTAFGLIWDGTKTVVIGAQHEIGVKAKDPQSQTDISDYAGLPEGKSVVIGPDQVQAIKDKTKSIADYYTVTPDEYLNDEWVKNQMSQDQVFDKLTQDFKDKYKDDYRKNLAKYWQDRFRDQLRSRKVLGRNKVFRFIVDQIKPEDSTPNKPQDSTTPPPVTTSPPTTSPPTQVKPVPQSLVIFGYSNSTNIAPGTSLNFRAVMRYSDGSQANVTDSGIWSADSTIGRISAPGVLTTPTSSQYQTVTGQVRVKWTNPENGQVFNASSTIQISYNFEPNSKP